RVATDRPGIMTPELYHPVLDCFLRGLPHLYRDTEAPTETVVVIEIVGDCGGQWLLEKANGGWELVKQSLAGEHGTRLKIPPEIAWRVFTKGIDRHSASAQIKIEGDPSLGHLVLELTAVIA